MFLNIALIIRFSRERTFVSYNPFRIMIRRYALQLKTGFARASSFIGRSAFDSVRTRNRLVWLYVWHYTLRYKADFFQIHFCLVAEIYSLSLTPFSEMYELRGYVVEGYQWYTPNLVVWHAKCCCVLLIICWSKHGFAKKRSFVDETSSSLTNR